VPEKTKSSFDQLYEKIEAAVKDLTTLKVITAVGAVDISRKTTTKNGVTEETRVENYQNAKAVLSTIDLIDGDIMTVMDEVFVTDAAYAGIREEHLARIQDAQAIVDKNVVTLLSMVETVGKILREINEQRQIPEEPIP
jgi:hypothetical protein